MDNCCFNRPFDDQANYRIHLETEAIKTILNLCEKSWQSWKLVISEVSLFEIRNTPDQSKLKELEWLMTIAERCINLTEGKIDRAKEFEKYGLKTFDALHLACAELEVDVFLTVDDRFLKKSQSFHKLQINVSNPLRWIEEVL